MNGGYGQAEIGVIQYQLLFLVPDVEIVGPLPGNLQDTTIFSGAILSAASDAAAAEAFILFLRSPEAAAVIKTKGMEAAYIYGRFWRCSLYT